MCRKQRSREDSEAIDMWAGLFAQLGEACALSLVREYQSFFSGIPFRTLRAAMAQGACQHFVLRPLRLVSWAPKTGS